MKKSAFVTLGLLLFAGCVSPTPPPDSKMPVKDGTENMEIQREHGMNEKQEMMGEMATQTEELQQPCDTLKTLSAEEKSALMTEIAHHMDNGALKKILGPDCMLFTSSELPKVSDITDAKLKFNPKDSEVLYYIKPTNQFFVSCTSLNTVAYVVLGDNAAATNPSQFFSSHTDAFLKAAADARMMGGNMTMENKDMKNEGMMNEEKEMNGVMKENKMMMQKSPSGFVYEDYSDAEFAALKGKEPFALFFHASWCPICKKLDADITMHLSQFPANTAILKTDYDTSVDLKMQYGITVQSTFVFFDKTGTVIGKATNPSMGEVMEKLKTA